ncbi:unnamed protein product, partial [Urochloa humidicola]
SLVSADENHGTIAQPLHSIQSAHRLSLCLFSSPHSDLDCSCRRLLPFPLAAVSPSMPLPSRQPLHLLFFLLLLVALACAAVSHGGMDEEEDACAAANCYESGPAPLGPPGGARERVLGAPPPAVRCSAPSWAPTPRTSWSLHWHRGTTRGPRACRGHCSKRPVARPTRPGAAAGGGRLPRLAPTMDARAVNNVHSINYWTRNYWKGIHHIMLFSAFIPGTHHIFYSWIEGQNI